MVKVMLVVVAAVGSGGDDYGVSLPPLLPRFVPGGMRSALGWVDGLAPFPCPLLLHTDIRYLPVLGHRKKLTLEIDDLSNERCIKPTTLHVGQPGLATWHLDLTRCHILSPLFAFFHRSAHRAQLLHTSQLSKMLH